MNNYKNRNIKKITYRNEKEKSKRKKSEIYLFLQKQELLKAH